MALVHLLKIVNCKLKIAVLVLFLGMPFAAHAGLIFKAPASIGLISGLVGYWSFDGPDMAGNIAYDRSGSYATGTLTNGPARVLGKIGQALSFDGSNDNLAMTNGFVIGTQSVSVSAWINSDVNANFKALYFGGDGGTDLITLYITPTGNIRFNVRDGAEELNGGTFDTAGLSLERNWHHVASIWDQSANVGRIYVDGALVATSNTNSNIADIGNSTTAKIGSGNNENFFSGATDEVRVYNRALNENEVRRLYRMGATLKLGSSQASNTGSLTQGLVGYWSFDGPDIAATSTGSGAIDRSGSNNLGYLINGPQRVVGRIGQALSFDGMNDRVISSAASSLLLSGNASMSAWVYLRSLGSAQGDGVIIAVEAGPGESQTENALFWLDQRTNKSIGYIHEYAAGSNESKEFTVNLQLNRWYHIAATRDSASKMVIFYLDGTKFDTFAYTNQPDNSATNPALQAGSRNDSTDATNSLIDEVRVYNRALNENEIRRLYRMGATLKVGSSQSLNTDSLKSGLVGYWSFDGPEMAATSTGSAAIDRSGNNNLGYLINGPQRVVGRIGQALNFDGSNDLIKVTASASINDIGPMTISAWVYPRSIGEGQFGAIISKDGINNGSWYLGFSNGTDLEFGKFFGGLNNLLVITSGSSIKLNDWSHVVATWDGSANTSGVHIYKNLVEYGYSGASQNGTGNNDSNASNDLIMGNWVDSSVTFDGLIDEVRIYNRALSPDEIRRLYNMGR